MGSLYERFKENDYKPFTPFTDDQVLYIEDLITRTMLWHAREELLHRKLKGRMKEELQWVRNFNKKK
jgi:hypothetical protein